MQLGGELELKQLILSLLRMNVQRSKYRRAFKRVVLLQAYVRRHLIQSSYRKLRADTIILQRGWRRVANVKRTQKQLKAIREARGTQRQSELVTRYIPSLHEITNARTHERLSLHELVVSQLGKEPADMDDALVDLASDRALFFVIYSLILWRQAGDAIVADDASEETKPPAVAGMPTWSDESVQLGWFTVNVQAQGAVDIAKQHLVHASLLQGTLVLETERRGSRAIFGAYPLALCQAGAKATSNAVVLEESRTLVWERTGIAQRQVNGNSAQPLQNRSDGLSGDDGKDERADSSAPDDQMKPLWTRSERQLLYTGPSPSSAWWVDRANAEAADLLQQAHEVEQGADRGLAQPWQIPLEPAMCPECLSFSNLDGNESSRPPLSNLSAGSLARLHQVLAKAKSDSTLIDKFCLTPKTAITQADVRKHIKVHEGAVTVDGIRRYLKWASGDGKQDIEGTIISVQQLRTGVDLVNGLVTLDTGTTFRNPVDTTPQDGENLAQPRILKTGFLLRKLNGQWGRRFFVLSDDGELKWYCDPAEQSSLNETGGNSSQPKPLTENARGGRRRKTKKKAVVQDVTQDPVTVNFQDGLESFGDYQPSGCLMLRFFMLQASGQTGPCEEPCEDQTLVFSGLLSMCTRFNVRSGTEVLQLAADPVVAAEWMELLEGQCHLHYQKSPYFLNEQNLLRIHHMDGKVYSIAISEMTTIGDIMRRLSSAQTTLSNSSEWALFEHQQHDTGLIDDPCASQHMRLPHDELILDQVLMRWEKVARRIYGVCPMVPREAFRLFLRKVTPPSPVPSQAELSLEWKQIHHDLVTGRLVSTLRMSLQRQLSQRLGLHWVKAKKKPTGDLVENQALAEALSGKMADHVTFTREELEMFGLHALRHNSFVRVSDHETYYVVDLEAWCGLKQSTGVTHAKSLVEHMSTILDCEVLELASLLTLVHMNEKRVGDMFTSSKKSVMAAAKSAKQGRNPTLAFKLKSEDLKAVLPHFMVPEDEARRSKLLSALEVCYNRLLKDPPQQLLKMQDTPRTVNDSFTTRTARLVYAMRTSSSGAREFDNKGNLIVDARSAMLTVRQRLMNEPMCFGGLFEARVWSCVDQGSGRVKRRPALHPAVVTIDYHGLHLLTSERVPRPLGSLGFLLQSGKASTAQGTLAAWQGIEHSFQSQDEEVLYMESRVLLKVKWDKLGPSKPAKGVQLFNFELSTWLSQNAGIMQRDQWKAFGVKELHPHHFIKVGDWYFRPVRVRDQSVALHFVIPQHEIASGAPLEEQGTTYQRSKLILITREGQHILQELRHDSVRAKEQHALQSEQLMHEPAAAYKAGDEAGEDLDSDQTDHVAHDKADEEAADGDGGAGAGDGSGDEAGSVRGAESALAA